MAREKPEQQLFFAMLLGVLLFASGLVTFQLADPTGAPPWLPLSLLGLLPPAWLVVAHGWRRQRERHALAAAAHAQAKSQAHGQQFFAAMNLLHTASPDARLGGIYALEGLARESSDHSWMVTETLAAFIRARAPWWPEQETPEPEGGKLSRASVEIQSAVTALGRRPWPDPEGRRILLNNADLRWVNLKHARLANADFEESCLREADLTGADLSGANLMEANLRSAFLVEAKLTGATLINAELRNAILVEADLSKADLELCDLQGAVLGKVRLSKARLRKANLAGANLTGATLDGADLSRANLAGAALNGAELSGADLENADLTRADLRRAKLHEAVLWKANLTDANLEGASLTGAVYGPDTIFPAGFDPRKHHLVLREATDHDGTRREISSGP